MGEISAITGFIHHVNFEALSKIPVSPRLLSWWLTDFNLYSKFF